MPNARQIAFCVLREWEETRDGRLSIGSNSAYPNARFDVNTDTVNVEDWAATIITQIARYEEAKQVLTKVDDKLLAYDTGFLTIARHPVILDMVGQVIGPDWRDEPGPAPP